MREIHNITCEKEHSRISLNDKNSYPYLKSCNFLHLDPSRFLLWSLLVTLQFCYFCKWYLFPCSYPFVATENIQRGYKFHQFTFYSVTLLLIISNCFSFASLGFSWGTILLYINCDHFVVYYPNTYNSDLDFIIYYFGHYFENIAAEDIGKGTYLPQEVLGESNGTLPGKDLVQYLRNVSTW